MFKQFVRYCRKVSLAQLPFLHFAQAFISLLCRNSNFEFFSLLQLRISCNKKIIITFKRENEGITWRPVFKILDTS